MSSPPLDSELHTDASVAKLGRELSNCMLERYAITTASVILGTVLGLKQKNLRPFVSCVTIGTLSDLAYGYFFCCKDLLNKYEAAKRSLDNSKKDFAAKKN